MTPGYKPPEKRSVVKSPLFSNSCVVMQRCYAVSFSKFVMIHAIECEQACTLKI